MTGDRPQSGSLPSGPVDSATRRGKLRMPLVSDHYIRRGRLHSLLDEVTGAPLTLVVAPAGAGKTSLLAGWMAERPSVGAWLALDDSDWDAGQFWSDFIAVVGTIVPGYGATVSSRLRQLAGSAVIVDELLDAFDEEPHPETFVVIDDLHLIDDGVVGSPLGLLAQHLPPWLHLIGITRRDVTVPLERLRTRDQLGEVRFPELRFSADEAAEMLSELAPSVTGERLLAMTAQAQGWAASLQLAALAERSALAQPGVGEPKSADDSMIHDYVWHEVLAAEDPELIEVLQATAVVERVNGSLALALTGRPDAGHVLLQAKARGLFVTRLGVEGWFEVHSLVRMVLRTELRDRAPDRLLELHARAAAWYEEAGEVSLALEHWIEGACHRRALRLLAAKHAELYDTGREATILRTIVAIPPHIVAGDLDAMMEFAWCHLLVDRHRFLELVDQLRWWAERSPEDTPPGRVAMLQSIAATMRGEWVDGGVFARRAMEELGTGWWRDALGRFSWNMVARDVALSERWDDAADEVREIGLALSRDPERRLTFEGTHALGEALAGRPLDALRVIGGVRQVASVAQMSILHAELATAEAVAHRELGDRPRALAQLQSLADAPAETMLYCRVLAMLELAQARLDEGDREMARATFADAEATIDAELPGQGARSWLARTGTVLALADGDGARAARWAEQVMDGFWGGVSWARVHLATGDRDKAMAALDGTVPRCPRHEVVLGLLRARATGDKEEAMKAASRVVDLAAADGLLQTIASEGREAAELVERAAWRAPEQWIDRLRRASAEQQLGAAPLDLVEQLTDRERDVLRFLPSRLTVHEIADELYVSVNTLKFHLKIIYRKLGVRSRAEAAEVARRMTRAQPGPS